MSSNFKTPVLFLIFNRFETTKRVFEEIKKTKPKKLYIASDGPRSDVIGEYENVKDIRQFVESNIDWDCEIKTLYREENLGCKFAVSGAIDWFFEQEENGIILEDDCLPNQSFFKFCEELLEKYKNDDRIAVISGDNFNNDKIGESDYYFSRIPHIWGWASWRRVWKKYDVRMREFPNFKNNKIIDKIWKDKRVASYWVNVFNEVYGDRIDTWDYQLTFSMFLNNSFCICPSVNLVSNIGFGNNFTNTVFSDGRISNLPTYEINFPINHPDDFIYYDCADAVSNKINLKNFYLKKFLKKILVFKILKKIYIYAMSYLSRKQSKKNIQS